MDWSLDTGSIPVGSTKKQKGTHLASFLFFFLVEVSELNTLVPTALESHPGFPSIQSYKTVRTNRVHIRTADASSLFVSGKVANIRHRRNSRPHIYDILY